MEKKYIIELPENTHWIQWIMEGTKDHHPYMDYKQVEDLTPYTEHEPHAEVTADAYQRGYEAGLNDAWECAREIGKNSMCSLEEMGFDFSQCGVNDYNPSWFVVKNYSASEAIEKIEQYGQEQQFHVGDEFENESGKRFVIIKMNGNKIDRYVDEEGKTYCLFQEYRIMRKTGRHFPEIAIVLKKIREGQDE